ncbi:vascular endothelial growth factor receptor 1-like isoform X2 [Microplitis demolitor]|uniref:vascular endothelial growth factor receptor 1-like isoform X2 n=1 Tax=Microplitis demolitor TaxID=69319 RepID=UPI0004CCF074|nr:vascular endothelial growth factor receptor 1-like isoform X2 [Microplitis demolitor]
MLFKCFLLFNLNIYLLIALTIDIKSTTPTVIMQSGEILQINCANFENHIFYYPKNNSEIVTSEVKITKINENNKYTGVLERFITVYGDTGWYGCIESDSCATFNDNSSNNYWVYVYVTSNEHLFINNNYKINYLQSTTDDNVTIPCRPTSPFYSVRLLHNDNLIQNNEKLIFNPRTGFVLNNLGIKNIGYYSCEITYRNNTDKVSFFLYITSKLKNVNQPIIINNELLDRVTEGQVLVVNCSVEIESDILYNLYWTKPNQDRRMTTRVFKKPLGVTYYQALSELMVSDIAKSDQGNYQCCIISGFIKKCDKKYITILNINDTNINR